jgi:two-component system CheB/CheR fusion protein
MKKKSAQPAKKSKPTVKKAIAKTMTPGAKVPKPFPIVGIGASAGGLEASKELLKNLRPDLGMAYVFVHHLSPNYDSRLAEILQRETAMPVSVVMNRMPVRPDEVYVIPPDTFMSIEDGHLKLTPREKLDAAYHSIDFFLTTLAPVYQHNAIGVLLSGTATDGTIGFKAIKEAGGITFAQDESARHSQMPVSAQDAGYVDYVLPPYRIAEELAALIRHPYAAMSPNDELEKKEKEIKKILTLVLQKYDVDFFAHYKRTTVYRRIMRRMALNKTESFDQYLKKLRDTPQEIDALYEDFLINVTSFFREPAFYNALSKSVFPLLVKSRKSADAIRIWIPGCATGEEAYSTAICLTEYLESKKIVIPVQIFSTDLDEKAITKARIGVYSKSAVQHIAPQRLKTFFAKVDGHYQIIKTIRDMCIFSVHNLMKDPPFSRIDLISCQNVLIYIEAAPQRKILQAFHYSLKSSGFLLLGKSESIGNATELFQPIEKDSRLYTKKINNHLPRVDFAVRPHPTSPVLIRTQPEARTETDVERQSDKLLLSRYVPASVLVNKDLEILRFRGNTSGYFEPSSGKASLNLLKMLKEELVFELRGMLQKARKTEGPITRDGIQMDSSGQSVSIEITPIPASKEVYYLIVFRDHQVEVPSVKTKATRKEKGDQKAKLVRLEHALKDAREQIRAITEDFDVSREELQSANEEILSSNEELQSINEELETSKEELQSSNEELTTINEELQTRLGELKQSRDYAEAIIETIRGPLLVLNAQMRIRTANKAFYDFFKLKQDETEGTFIYELNDHQWDIPSLRDHLRDMFPKKIHFKDFEINHTFPNIGNKTMMVNAHRLVHTEGTSETQILVAFEDITRYRTAEQTLRETQQQLKLALEGGSVGIWSWNIKTGELTGSKEQTMLFGLSDGKFFSNITAWEKAVFPEDLPVVNKALQHSIVQRTPLDIEFRIVWPDQSIHWILSKANANYSHDGKPEIMLGVNIDITERKRAIEALEESEKRFHHMSDNAPVMIWMTDHDKRCNFLNKTWLSFRGRTMEEELGEGWYEGIHPDDKKNFLEVYDAAYANRQEFKIDYRLKRHDGEYRWIMAHGLPRYTNNDTFIGYIGTCIDINERIDLERQKDDFMGIASHELKTPVTSIKAYTQILQQKFQTANDTTSTAMLGRLDSQIDKLTNLINTLLDVARIQSGQMDYDLQPFDVKEFVTEVTEDLQRTTPKHQLLTKFNAEGTVFADRARTGQVLNNLLSNAIKYSPDSNKIVIQTDGDENNITFTIQDYGAGIPKNVQDKIFSRFFRVSESSGNRVSGLGLGLFIASEIVRQQGGKIWLESEPGKGSKFSFSLPVKEQATSQPAGGGETSQTDPDESK